jgi:hypothetical protein
LVRFTEALPWTLMTFAVAYGVAVMADDEPADLVAMRLGHRSLRTVETFGMVAFMVPVSLLVYRLLLDTQPIERIPPLSQVLATVVIVSVAIGALVPSWYRQSPSTNAAPRLAAAPAPAAG